jgi:hypothetical protein
MADEVDSAHHLKQLSRAYADNGQLQDYERSNALATDQMELSGNYWLQLSTVGAVFSIGLAVTASYWGFSPPAAILTSINEDIGRSWFFFVVCPCRC